MKWLENLLGIGWIFEFLGKNVLVIQLCPVYVIELALKFTPFPLSVQRKNLSDAEALYEEVRRCIEKGQPRILEITCEKVEDKKITVLVSELMAVQVYEKTAASGGTKRPGFSFDA